MRQDTTLPKRYRLERAGIHNVWQYDNHIFEFGDGRLLLRGRNGAGKSKALEMLLPFLLDGDARRLDTTGTSRTSLRWLMLEGRTATETGDTTATQTDTTTLGYLWVEFARRGDDGQPQRRTLGAAVLAVPDQPDARPIFFVTDRRVGDDLTLIEGGRPLPIERLRAAVGPDNCYDTALGYRTRVMRDLFGLDDPMRYRNLIHLLYRLRRPTVGERLEAGELVSVLSEALPRWTTPSSTRSPATSPTWKAPAPASPRCAPPTSTPPPSSPTTAATCTASYASRPRRYASRSPHSRNATRNSPGSKPNSTPSSPRRARHKRNATACAAPGTPHTRTRDLTASAAHPRQALSRGEREARYAAVAAYIRAAEAAWVASEHARSAESQAHHRIDRDCAAIERGIGGLRRLHFGLRDAARASGIDPARLGEVPSRSGSPSPPGKRHPGQP